MRASVVLASVFGLLPSACGTVVCDCACPDALLLVITHPAGASPTVRGEPSLACTTYGDATSCRRHHVDEAGAFTYEVHLDGHAPRAVSLAAERDGVSGGCCNCSWRDRSAQVSFGPADAGLADASIPDAGARDASSPDAGVSCRPERVEFPMGGELSPGALCDSVFVCADDEAAVARLQAASSRFDCTSEPSGYPCGDEVRCAYRTEEGGGPSTLDEHEIADICAVTVLEPPLRIVCVVYL